VRSLLFACLLSCACFGCSEADPAATECPAKPPLFGTRCIGRDTCTYNPCGDGQPSISAVCIDGTFSISTHICAGTDGGFDTARDTSSEAETDPPLSGGIGKTCVADELCDPTDVCGSLLGYPGDDPDRTCSSDGRTCKPDDEGIARCDGPSSICIASVCMASCRVSGGVVTGCAGRTACNIVSYVGDVAHGYCAFGCTRDADCLDPDAPHCSTEIGRCRATTDPLTKHPGESCVGNGQCLCVSGVCQQFCRTGESDCGGGKTCVPFGPTPPTTVTLPSGLGGTCQPI
jgi:hypothetical protein